MADYVSLTAWADAHGLSGRTVRRYLADGKLPGARKRGKSWEIPADALPPYTRPGHMRPASRVIPGEVVDPRPHPGTAVATAVPLFTPERPLFYTLPEFEQLCGGRISRTQLLNMIRAGELRGLRRGERVNGHATWLIPASEENRFRRGDR